MTKVRHVQMSAFPDLAPDKPIGPILPSVFVGTNADLMAAVAPFYLTGSVLDVTYGEGKWWDRYRPDPFTADDKFKGDGVDFTDLPEPDNTYDSVCFDPPYVLSGGDSSGPMTGSNFQTRYGIGAKQIGFANNREEAFCALIRGGSTECARVTRKWLLVKCMEFAQGGRNDFHNTPFMVTTWAAELGMVSHDVIVHHTGSGPGGHNIYDPKRARRHHSYLLVFTKPPPPREAAP